MTSPDQAKPTVAAKRKSGGWGSPSAPLLPQTLRARWAEENLPDWVCDDLKLPPGSTLSALRSGPFPEEAAPAERVQGYLEQLLTSRRVEIQNVELLASPLPASVDLAQLPLRQRTKNCLVRHKLANKLSQ